MINRNEVIKLIEKEEERQEFLKKEDLRILEKYKEEIFDYISIKIKEKAIQLTIDKSISINHSGYVNVGRTWFKEPLKDIWPDDFFEFIRPVCEENGFVCTVSRHGWSKEMTISWYTEEELSRRS